MNLFKTRKQKEREDMLTSVVSNGYRRKADKKNYYIIEDGDSFFVKFKEDVLRDEHVGASSSLKGALERIGMETTIYGRRVKEQEGHGDAKVVWDGGNDE